MSSCSLQSLEGLNNINGIMPEPYYSITEFVIQNNPSLISLAGLESLNNVYSMFITNNDRIKNLNGIENLQNVEYSFYVADNDSLLTLEGINLSESTIEYGFSCGYIPYDYGITIRNNASLESLSELSHLNYIFGNLTIEKNPKLINLSGLDNIKTVRGNSVIIRDNIGLENLNALNNLERIGFSETSLLEISYNPLIVNLNGLNNLSLSSELSFYIDSNENLTSLSGINEPIELENLSIRSNPKLSNIDQLASLESILSLNFSNNDLFEHLNTFDKVNSVVNFINITDNILLEDISGLKNIQSFESYECGGFIENGSLRIIGNPLLSDCAIMPICDALTSPDVEKYIENNGLSCNSPEDINCDEVSISGFVFYDLNQNGVLDVGENGISNIGINFDPPNQTILTKHGGKYIQVCEDGVEYEISFPDLDNYSLTTPTDKYTIIFQPGNSTNHDNNFGIYPDEQLHDVVSHISSNPTRCNSRIDFFLSLENIGTYQENGTLRIDFDSLSSYSWSSPKADSINLESNFLLWDIENFSPFDFQQIALRFDMPDETYTGTVLNFTSSVTVDSAGTEINLSDYTYSPTVLCSFDPNDKIVMPAGVYAANYTLKDEKLTYTVRFQNTGNAPATDVTIMDTLDNYLDIESFRVVNSSFTPQTFINGREVTFLFSNINLVDSISDERNSHGFVTFEIDPIGEIEDFSEIKNKAHIIFDSNAAIITNTVKNTMVTTIPTNTSEEQYFSSYSIYPNPISSEQRLKIDYHLLDPDLDIRISMYNNLGQEVISKDGSNGENELNIMGILPGIYIIGLKNNGQLIKALKVIIQR